MNKVLHTEILYLINNKKNRNNATSSVFERPERNRFDGIE